MRHTRLSWLVSSSLLIIHWFRIQKMHPFTNGQIRAIEQREHMTLLSVKWVVRLLLNMYCIVRQSREPGWLEGVLGAKKGLIPHNYVEFLNWHVAMLVNYHHPFTLDPLLHYYFSWADSFRWFSLCKREDLCGKHVIDSCV